MREPARWGRRTIATVTAVALAVGVALVASTTGPAPGPPEAAGSNDPAAACQDLRAGAMVACLHGNDAPPPGVSLYERPTLRELEARSSLRSPSPRLRGLAGLEQATTGQAAAEPAAVECIGNGTSGNRIQAIYARAVGATDRYSSLLPSLRQWAAEADQAVWLSAGQTGGGKRLRFVTDGDCQLDVDQVLLTTLAAGDFGQMRTELQALGYNRSDRKYLVWFDAAGGICGLGEVYGDTRPGPENYNNGGPMYARVDAPCFQYAELHEIFHNLGAVQRDAPNTVQPERRLAHCTDEADVMCYDDDGGRPGGHDHRLPARARGAAGLRRRRLLQHQPTGRQLPGQPLEHRQLQLPPGRRRPPAGPAHPDRRRHHHLRRPGQPAQPAHRRAGHHRHRRRAGQPVRRPRRPRRRAGRRHRHHRRRRRRQLHARPRRPPPPTGPASPAPATHGTASSARVTVAVRPRVSARLQDSTVAYGQTITVTGTVSPNHRGQRVYLQRLVNGSWKGAATATLTSASGYTLRAKAPGQGPPDLPGRQAADADHASGDQPRRLTVTVR